MSCNLVLRHNYSTVYFQYSSYSLHSLWNHRLHFRWKCTTAFSFVLRITRLDFISVLTFRCTPNVLTFPFNCLNLQCKYKKWIKICDSVQTIRIILCDGARPINWCQSFHIRMCHHGRIDFHREQTNVASPKFDFDSEHYRM